MVTFLGRDDSGGNFLATTLDPNTTEGHFNHHIGCIQNSKNLLAKEPNIFEKLILNLFDEFTTSCSQIISNLKEARVTQFLDVLGINLAKALILREKRKISQIKDLNLIANFYRTVLNNFDAKLDQKSSSFKQLKLGAFKQFSIDQNFAGFVKHDKKQSENLNPILIDLEIFQETSDGFHFVNSRDIEIFGFLKLHEILKETGGFNATFMIFENTEIESLTKFLCLTAVVLNFEKNPKNLNEILGLKPELIQQSLLARTLSGHSLFHILVASELHKSLIIEFLNFLKVQFGMKFIVKILTLKNREGLTFWSHSQCSNRNISDSEEIQYNTLLEETLSKLFVKETRDFENLKELALDLIFGRENLDRNHDEEFFEIEILTKVDDKIKYADSSFLGYFALAGLHKYLIKNYQKEEAFELCGNLLSDRENFRELCWLIEKFYMQKVNVIKSALNYFARIGEEKKIAFFFFLDILISQYKDKGKNDLKMDMNLSSEDGGEKTFLHNFCFFDYKWSEHSFRHLFNKLKELKRFVPYNEFREFLLLCDNFGTFLHCLDKSNTFEIALNFLHSEFEDNFIRKFYSVDHSFWSRN